MTNSGHLKATFAIRPAIVKTVTLIKYFAYTPHHYHTMAAIVEFTQRNFIGQQTIGRAKIRINQRARQSFGAKLTKQRLFELLSIKKSKTSSENKSNLKLTMFPLTTILLILLAFVFFMSFSIFSFLSEPKGKLCCVFGI